MYQVIKRFIPERMNMKSCSLCFLFFVQLTLSCQYNSGSGRVKPNWCDHPSRPGLEKLKEIKTAHTWFRVFDVGDSVYALTEPYQSQEVVSYLILGKDSALLFDTGMGLDPISDLVRELTKLPVLVLNSHTHPDHVGGNHEFEEVLAMSTDYTDANARNG